VAATQSGVSSYKVWVDMAGASPQVRSGMSANVEILIAQRAGVLLLPLRAVRAEGDALFVDLVEDQSLCAADLAALPAEPPALRPQPVRLGLTNDELAEVQPDTIGEGACVYVEGFDARLSLMQGTPMPSFRERRQGR
jgi:multidrug efflux pump subunit AcrA (membrane-fusion protein)